MKLLKKKQCENNDNQENHRTPYENHETKFIEIHLIITKIMKILEINVIIMKIIKILIHVFICFKIFIILFILLWIS